MKDEDEKMLKRELDARPDLQKHLFARGYLITTAGAIEDAEGYPFYGNWIKTRVGQYDIWVYHSVKLHLYKADERYFFLVGHAFDPYTMEAEESAVLEYVAGAYGTGEYYDRLDELTGIFLYGVIHEDGIEFLLDASGMQYGCYGCVQGKLYISSHMRLIGDLLGLEMSDYASRLIGYRWYRYMMGNYMPGDITCFDEIKRIVPNTCVRFSGGSFSVERFYPQRDIQMCSGEEDYQEVIREAAEVLKSTMALIPQKWDRPAISLTGGIDSNTTFAAANGVYDKYTTFSYVSMYRESVDAEKAKEISERFHVPWKRYDVPENNEELPDFDLYKRILEWNDGGIGSYSDSDIRKKITLIRSFEGEVEVKSWISETVRAYAYKYFGRKRFPKDLSARNYTSLYKIFVLNRRLVHETDRYFKDYWKNTALKEHLFNYDESDFFVWEMMHGGKCGLDIGVMKTCFDITIPYNNRKLLDLLLRVPLDKRISDQHHMDLKRILNRDLYDMNIRVVNLNETDTRKKIANLYYTVNSLLPF